MESKFVEVDEDGVAESSVDEGYSLADSVIREVANLIDDEYYDPIIDLCARMSPADVAELLSKIDSEHRNMLVILLENTMDPEVLTHLEPDLCNDVMKTMHTQQIAALLNALDSDDALALIADLDSDRQQEILLHLSRKMRAAVEEGLTFPEDSAGRLMQREMVAVPQFWTVGKTLDYMRAAGAAGEEALPDEFYDIFVVDPMHHVVGEVSLSRILRSKRSIKVQDLADPSLHTVPAHLDQEEVAFLFRREGITSAPVVDSNNRLIGMITIDDIVTVIDEEAQEDFLKIGGVATSDIHRATLSTARSRASWLAINLLTAIAASVVVGLFEGTIQQVVALAVLMPIVASMGGNAGTQTLTVAVRALATKDLTRLNAVRVTLKELMVGIINGAVFAVAMGVIAWLWFESPHLGMVIGAAMIINLTVAGLSGILIPLGLDRLGFDPALSSAVFLTTVTDIIGFFAFLGLAALFLL